jgi:protocatechuate 3,4-dioxygenase beta subunit
MGTFYTVVRQYLKGDSETHSMEIKENRTEAIQRYFNVLAADLQNAEITWNAAYIIDSNGLMIEGRVFDRTTTESEGTE